MGASRVFITKPSRLGGAGVPALAGALVLGAIYALLPAPPAQLPVTQASQPANSPWVRSPFGDAAHAPVSPAAPAAQAIAPSPLTQSQRVDRLTGSGDPADAYVAYAILRDCRLARAAESAGMRARPPAAEQCGDLSAAQLVASLQWLERAASAGVRGAVWDFVGEGPDGSRRVPMGTQQQLADPATAEYFRKLRGFEDAAARTGDRSAMMALSTYAENEERDLPKALAYWVAQARLAEAQGSVPSPLQEGIVARLSSGLTAEQAASAIQNGNAIAATAANASVTSQVEPLFAQAPSSFLEHTRDQAPLSALPNAGGARAWQPNDSFVVCLQGVCQQARYQASGLWLPDPVASASPGSGR